MIETPCLLDTDTLSYVLKKREPVHSIAMEYLQRYENFTISCMTFYECLRGYIASGATKRLDDFYSFLIFTDIIYLNRSIIETASEIYGTLKPRGALPGDADIFRLSDNSRDRTIPFINIHPKRAYPSRSR